MALELADIFRQFGPAYRQKYASRLLPSHRRTMRDIERCRTAALGGQVYRCSVCGEVQYSYHSCRNRHCPKCQQEQAQEWLQLQQELLLPVPYFFLTFTLPAQLRIFASQNQRLFYHAFFQASAQATQQLARDPRFIGAQIGMIGVLHTWTRTLTYHPHVHYLVPAGGWSAEPPHWRKAQHNFFLPVKALSKLFRTHFQHLLSNTPLFAQIPSEVWRLDWVVHCKAVGNGQTALKYLAPYIYRVALSNRRLIHLSDTGRMESSQVTFAYRPSGSKKFKRGTLSAEKFIQRFLQHVLPRGFVKVRYFGFFSPSQRPRLLSLQQTLLSNSPAEKSPSASPSQPASTSSSWLCPKCGQPMSIQYSLPPSIDCRSP